MLYLLVCNSYYNRYATNLRAGELPLEDLMHATTKIYGLPCFETIRRARARIQCEQIGLFSRMFPNSANPEDDSIVIPSIGINSGR